MTHDEVRQSRESTATKLGAQTEQGDTPEGPHMTLPASVMAAQQQRFGGQEARWSVWLEGFIDRLVTDS